MIKNMNIFDIFYKKKVKPLTKYEKSVQYVRNHYTKKEMENVSYRDLMYDIRLDLNVKLSADEMAAVMIVAEGGKFDFKKFSNF